MPPIGYISTILLFVILLSILLVVGESFLLEASPLELSGNREKGEWMERFRIWAFICAGSAGVASLLWYVLAQWSFKINRWEDTTGKRSIWMLLLLLPTVFIVVSMFRMEHAESSLTWVYLLLFFSLNGLLPYYWATVLFSPSPFKYTPIGAKGFRSRCFW
ncbi:MAG: hypothetical protein OXD49_10825 [Candidatus Poribacteria bacterium]|nr:hypothetical protein [Candidatus Poribacteria bacterium]